MNVRAQNPRIIKIPTPLGFDEIHRDKESLFGKADPAAITAASPASQLDPKGPHEGKISNGRGVDMVIQVLKESSREGRLFADRLSLRLREERIPQLDNQLGNDRLETPDRFEAGAFLVIRAAQEEPTNRS